MKFAKLFDVDVDSQVLVTRTQVDDDRDEAPYKVTVATDYKGIYLAAAHGFKSDRLADDMFHKYNQGHADKFFKNAVDMVEGATEEIEG